MDYKKEISRQIILLLIALILPIVFGHLTLMSIGFTTFTQIFEFFTDPVIWIIIALCWPGILIGFGIRIRGFLKEPEKNSANDIKIHMYTILAAYFAYTIIMVTQAINLWNLPFKNSILIIYLLFFGIVLLFVTPVLFITTIYLEKIIAQASSDETIGMSISFKLRITIITLIVGAIEYLIAANLGTVQSHLDTVDQLAFMMMRNNIVLAIFILAATIITIIAFMRSIKRPLDTLITGFNQGVQGNLTLKIEKSTGDEIGYIMVRYRHFTEKLRSILKTLIYSFDSIIKSGLNLNQNIEESVAAITEMKANVQSTNNQMQNQSSQVIQTTKAIEGITGHIVTLADQVQNQRAQIEESTAAVEEMIATSESILKITNTSGDQIKELVNSSDENQRNINEMVKMMQQLSTNSENLLEANKIISTIASQTNLLAMNAAIEAAHAGDSGRGFSVVAEEIRKLAERSSSESKTIKQNLKQILDYIKSGTLSAEKVNENFNKISQDIGSIDRMSAEIETAMAEQSTGGKSILESLSDLNEITGTVTQASEEMGANSQEITLTLETLNDITFEVRNTMEEMTSSIDQISSMLIALNDLSKNNTETINETKELLNFFKI